MSIDVVIVSYCSESRLRACIASLPRVDRVIVIDNASPDRSADVAEQLGCEVIRNPTNAGFGRAVNRVIRERVTSDFVLLLNPDARLQEGALDLLVGEMNDAMVAVAGPRLRTPDGNYQRPWWQFPSARVAWTEAVGLHRLRRPDFGRSADVPFVVGACLLVRVAAFRAVGGFDERYWLYGEEADLCRRLHNAGFRTRYVADAECEHEGGASGTHTAELVSEHFRRGYERFVQTHDGRRALASFRLANVVAAAVRMPFLKHDDPRRAVRAQNLRRAGRTLLRHPTRVAPVDRVSASRGVVICSLEPWDEVWRRNQFLVRELTDADPNLRVLFVEPAVDVLHELVHLMKRPDLGYVGALRAVEDRPQVLRYRPFKVLPRRLGPWTDRSLARQIVRAADQAELVNPTLWVNDPGMAPLLRHCSWPALYDITDDWLSASLGTRSVARIRECEERLLATAGTVVACSVELLRRKSSTRPVRLISNAVDLAHFRAPQPRPVDLPASPAVVYVGTLHDDRIDVALVCDVAKALPKVALVFVGPDALSDSSHELLAKCANVHLLGSRPFERVPAYLQHADVVIVPHLVNEFTESLDPIKAYECLAAGRPTLATPVAGFRGLDASIAVADRDAFATMLAELLANAPTEGPSSQLPSWRARAAEFNRALVDASEQPAAPDRFASVLRVVYLDHTAVLSGGELALLRLLPSIAARGVEPTVILGEVGPLVDELRSVGVPVEVLPMAPAARNLRRDRVRPGKVPLPAVWSSMRYVVVIARRLREIKPDLVHTNSLKSALYGGVAARLAGVPVVWHVRDRIADDYLPRPAVMAVRALARVVPSAIVANSCATLATVGRRTGPASITPSPVVMDAVVADSQAADFRHTVSTVAIVGRLSPWKGQDVFLEAFAKSFPVGDERALVVGTSMFGEDAFESELHALCHRLGITDRVDFPGFQRDVFKVLASVDVLVHASTVPEPFGQVIIEGMAAGVPVIATAAGGPLEIITHGENGLLVAPNDVDALAAALRRLADDPATRQRLSANGRVRAADFTPDRIAGELMSVYARVSR